MVFQTIYLKKIYSLFFLPPLNFLPVDSIPFYQRLSKATPISLPDLNWFALILIIHSLHQFIETFTGIQLFPQWSLSFQSFILFVFPYLEGIKLFQLYPIEFLCFLDFTLILWKWRMLKYSRYAYWASKSPYPNLILRHPI